VIKYVGFVDFFIGTSLLGIPVALLACYLRKQAWRLGRRRLTALNPLSDSKL
jgi:hypothetical protein